ncbi:hypothetical protein [Halopiger goleimassiliensis]|uniref:hypothetical protein n=1 Tax=Halopiger goleimassiliensis TaxID=1293048 RepID=UPI0006776BFF|nr:hypothetical protein [Halopiger goleimassiliensis]
MNVRAKSALLWGAVGVVAVLALVQGYALLVEPLLSIGQAAAVAALVGCVTTGCAYALEHRIADWAARRATDDADPGANETEAHRGDGKSKS